MKRVILAAYVFTFICTLTVQANLPYILFQNPSISDDEVTVSYVGNAGFLINIGDTKILIDAIFKGSPSVYELPQPIQNGLKLAQAPFNDVDLILVTHAHGDHIDPEMVRQHLQNNPKAIFASTQQMVNALNGFPDRCIAFNPTKEKSESKMINDIRVEAFYLPHGTNAQIINIGFLISVNGINVFQTGDVDFDQFTFEEFRSLQLPEKKIDLSFIQHFYLTNDSVSKKFVTEGIGGRYIIPIHYHFTTPAFDPTIVKQNYPDAVLFEKELQSWIMPVRNDEISTLSGVYLNQPLPGDSAVVFAPGIVSVDTTVEHGSPTFSTDGNEVFWQSNYRQTGKKTQILGMTMRRINDRWSAPERSQYDSGPVFSPDGKRLYFLPSGEENGEKNGPYYAEKKDNNWLEPVCMNLLARFPEIKFAYNYSVTRDGTFYFLGYAESLGAMNDFGIYRMELNNGEYSTPELLPPCINIGKGLITWTPFIAPDESYLLFSSNRQSPDTDYGDIYGCFRKADGSWTEAINLGTGINSGRQERFPSISPDGKYLFFTRWVSPGNEDVMWASAKIIEDLKKEAFESAGSEIKLPKGAFPMVYRGHIYIPGAADGIKGNFVFDTGASNLYYDSTYYADNEFKYNEFFKAKLPGAGTKPQDVIVVKDTVSFTFGNYLYRTPQVPVLKLKPILGDFSDGIIGLEYFHQSVLEINYEQEYMRIFPDIDSINLSDYCKIDLLKDGNRLFVPLKVKINDTLEISGNYQLDFGSGGSIAFTSSTTEKFNLLESIETKTPYYSKYAGVGGESSSFDFMATGLQIGDFAFNNVTMDFSIDKSGAMASNKHFGLLGNGIYERFHLYIDFINNDLYIKPNSKYTEPFRFSRLGFSYVDRNQTMNAWIVTGLYSACNAEKQGLKIDDKIIAVNGIGVDRISYESQKGFFDSLSEVSLTINRNSEIKEITFKLESIQ